MKYLRKHNENMTKRPVEDLVREILEACKFDVDEVEENDPDLIAYIANMIKKWSKE